jgi:hypothetical protein
MLVGSITDIGEMTMNAPRLFGEPFGFWLVQVFLASQDGQSEEYQQLSNKCALTTGTVIVIVIALVGVLLSH